MNPENAEVQAGVGTLGAAGEVGLHVANAKWQHVNKPSAKHPMGFLAQTGRRLTKDDWCFLNAIPNSWGVCGETRIRAWCIYEYARESETIRTWAIFLANAAADKMSLVEGRKRNRIVDRLRIGFPGPRDGWVPNLLVIMAQHLSADRAWTEIDETERNEGVEAAIRSYEALHQLAGNIGDVRNRKIGVRLTWRNDDRELASTRDEQLQSFLKVHQRRGKPTEVFRFEVDWKGTRNTELAESFKALLQELRPKNYAELPSLTFAEKSGIKPTALCTALADLGMMRLRHTLPSGKITDLTGKALDAQSDMGKRARNNFRRLFPFLPIMERARAEQLLLKRAS